MIKIILIILAFIYPPEQKPTKVKVGTGSTFYPNEKLNNGKFACGGDWVDPDIPVCATRTPSRRSWGIPCGAWVHIENVRTGDTAWCKVMDRGPYGKHDENGKWFNSSLDRRQAEAEGRERRKGKYRGIIDMSKSVSDKLNSKGLLRVRVKYWKNNEHRELLDNTFFGKDIYTRKRRKKRQKGKTDGK